MPGRPSVPGLADASAPRADGGPAASAAGEAVDVALVLAADCSGSISNANLRLQFDGYAGAIASPAVIAAVQGGPLGRIALTFIAWADSGRERQLVPWMLIDGMDAARRFTAALAAATLPVPGTTSISGAIDFAAALLRASGYAAARRVIDISGDGRNNDGRPVTAARDDAVAAGIVINGLPLLGAEAGIARYYAENVIGGQDAFVHVARDLAVFRVAALRKLVAEIAGRAPSAPAMAG